MNNETYTTTVKDFYTGNFASFLKVSDVDCNQASAIIYWELEVEARERGIKYISISVTKVIIEIEWYYNIEDTSIEDQKKLIDAGGREMMNGNIEGSFTIDSTKPVNGKEWTVKEEFYFEKDGGIMPEKIQIDFETLTITIE